MFLWWTDDLHCKVKRPVIGPWSERYYGSKVLVLPAVQFTALLVREKSDSKSFGIKLKEVTHISLRIGHCISGVSGDQIQHRIDTFKSLNF